MVYLLEANLPENKSIYFGLISVFGVSNSRSCIICKKLGFSRNLKVKDLSSAQIRQVSSLIESLSFIVANDLKRLNLLNSQKFVLTKSYRGLRRKKGFPVRGQRTHTNARTAKRNRGK